ncbi:MAG: type II toxin-antitoxin system HicA family toxin [Candidatus Kapabacteria bacterium]|nr:type II toxin-antitoxin system HicA family toxin [Candidatus Kapabacteria bacterium]
MPKLPVLTPAELIKILLKNGFEIDRINGSHHVLINKSSKIRLVVPVHKKDLPKGTLYEIIKQSGLKTDIFA